MEMYATLLVSFAKQETTCGSTVVSHDPAIVYQRMPIVSNFTWFLIVDDALISLIGIALATIVYATVLERILLTVLVRWAVLGEGQLVALGVVVVKRMWVFCLYETMS